MRAQAGASSAGLCSFAGNAIFTEEIDEEGNAVSTAALDTSNETAPAEFKDGHLWFTANGEHIDITSQVSDATAYIYDYKDGQGITHYLIVGGAPETFGYAEFLYDETKQPGWVSGYLRRGKSGKRSILSGWKMRRKSLAYHGRRQDKKEIKKRGFGFYEW